MASINRRKRLSDIALDLGKKRRKKDAQTASINDEGWELLDLAKNSLFMLDSVEGNISWSDNQIAAEV